MHYSLSWLITCKSGAKPALEFYMPMAEAAKAVKSPLSLVSFLVVGPTGALNLFTVQLLVRFTECF